jgi:hypothetical protein
VLRDDVADVTVFRTPHARDGMYPLAAVQGSPPVHTGVYKRRIHERLAPPIGWVHGAAGGLVVALLPLVGAPFFRRRAREVEGRDAIHRGGGVIELDDGRTTTIASAARLPMIAVRVDAPPSRTGYREAPPLPTRVLSTGTVAEAREELESRSAGASLAALVIVAWTAAPLAMAVAHGLGL